MTAPVILIEASPKRAADGVVETVRLAGGGGSAPYFYGGEHWRAGVTALPTIITALDFPGDDLGTGGVPQALELRWAPARSADLALQAGYYWTDAPVTVHIGPEGAMPPVVLPGKVLDVSAEDGSLRVAIADPAAELKRPLLVDRFAGTGGIEGPAEWEGVIKRRAWGRRYNVKGEPIDAANHIYCFGDPMRAWQAFDAVRDKGAAAAALDPLAWQGTAAATFAVLQAAVAPQGGCVACPSIACVKWWSEPAGDLTADIRGEIGAGYVETAAEIAARIVAARSTLPFAAGTIAVAAAARPGIAGWLADDESMTIASVLDALLGDVSLLWVLDAAGAIDIRQWAWGASVAQARSHQVVRRKVHKPVATRRIGYRQNAHVMSRGDIAAIVFAVDVLYGNGLTAEELRPSEPNATHGATAEQIAAISQAFLGNSKIWTRPTPPAESKPGDYWRDSANGYRQYVRVDGYLTGNGNRILGTGNLITATWNAVDDTRIQQAVTAAATAQATADAAGTRADQALGALDDLADDALLTIHEKVTVLIPRDADLEGAWGVLDAQAASFAITTERTAAAAARTAWRSYRDGLAPAWNSAAADTAVVRTTFRQKLLDYGTALDALQKAISQKASETAEWDLVTGAGKTVVVTAASNFNARNDRSAAAITAPAIAADGSALDHATNTDGSVDISFEWAWSGAEADIDGWLVYLRSNAAATPYVIGSSPADEAQFVLDPAKRALILTGVAGDRYYTFGVRAYRQVDPDVAASGRILSAIAQSAVSGEHPYQPNVNISYAGNVSGTVGGVPVAQVNQWPSIAGAGKPADNATRNLVTYDAVAPPSPVDGHLWVDISGSYAVFKLRSGGAWVTGANALSAYNALSGLPVALADINTTESTKLAGIETAADVTMLVTGVTSIEVKADYDGTVKAGELPRDVPFKMIRAATSDVTAASSWVRTVKGGSITCTIGAATGVLAITALGSTAEVEIAASYAGVVRKITLVVDKKLDPPPNTGSGSGTSASDSTIAGCNSISYPASANAGVLTVKPGTGGTVTLTAPLTFKRGGSTAGTSEVYGKWQWRPVGGTWADVAAEVLSTFPATTEVEGAFVYRAAGDIAINASKTGLTAGTDYEFQVLLRNAIGTITHNFAGTATAQGS